mgnify:CR=1 FL=1
MKKTLAIAFVLTLSAGFASAQITNSSAPGLAFTDSTCTGADGSGGLTDSIAFTETGTITDVNVQVDMTHTWRSDLQFHVEYSVGGGIVILAADHDSFGDNYHALFDQEAGTACIDATLCGSSTAGGPCETAPGPICAPDGDLSSFYTLASPGTWTLAACDDAAGDSGTFDSWAVTLDGPGLPVELMSFQVD